MTWRVMVPSAMPGLMVGVNQVIMLSLNMVIIASMIGAGGLGYEVLAALRRLDIGTGIEAGLAIVALAIALDRLSQAIADKQRTHENVRPTSVISRHPYVLTALVMVGVTALVGIRLEALHSFPESLQLSTGSFWADVVRWINVNFFDQLEAIKDLLLLNILIPIKRLLLGLPWAGVVGLIILAGWSLGGVRLAVTVGGLALLIALTGQWDKAMITVYLCGISVVIACNRICDPSMEVATTNQTRPGERRNIPFSGCSMQPTRTDYRNREAGVHRCFPVPVSLATPFRLNRVPFQIGHWPVISSGSGGSSSIMTSMKLFSRFRRNPFPFSFPPVIPFSIPSISVSRRLDFSEVPLKSILSRGNR